MRDLSGFPKWHELLNPLLKALHELGGSGSIKEIDQKVIESLNLPEEIVNLPQNSEKSSQTVIEYRLAWTRTNLKRAGFLENSGRGVWSIAPEKRKIMTTDKQEIIEAIQAKKGNQKEDLEKELESEVGQDIDIPEEMKPWRSVLHSILINEMSPDSFERLAKRVLRESGFVQVEVTGKSGDGGIDGKGIMRLSGLLSFHVLFQCKKYKGSVSASDIRDFRGAMIGRADKGLFLTTGTFTSGAVREATRDGAPPIDLVNGDQLADKLKELGLGIKKEMVEKVSVDEEWFKSI